MASRRVRPSARQIQRTRSSLTQIPRPHDSILTRTVTGRKTPPPAAAVTVGADGIAARKETRAASIRDLMNELRAGGDGQDDAVWMGAAPT